jgi:hypothetical protein
MGGFGMDKYNSEAYLRYLKDIIKTSLVFLFLCFFSSSRNGCGGAS